MAPAKGPVDEPQSVLERRCRDRPNMLRVFPSSKITGNGSTVYFAI